MRRQSIKHLEFSGIQCSEDGKKIDYSFASDRPVYFEGGTDRHTLLKLMLGLTTPSSGIYRINGLAMNELSHSEFDQYRLNMGHSFEAGGLINNQTLYENYLMLLDYHDFLDPKVRFHHIVKLMELFNLDQVKHLRPANVTGGQRKAASVLRAFLLRPEMVVLDNPTFGLPYELIPILVDLIHEHQIRWNLKHIMIVSDDREFKELLPGDELRLHELSMVHGRAA